MGKRISLENLCDGCHEFMDESDTIFGFKLEDDYGKNKSFVGHYTCITALSEKIQKAIEKKEE